MGGLLLAGTLGQAGWRSGCIFFFFFYSVEFYCLSWFQGTSSLNLEVFSLGFGAVKAKFP